MPPFNRDSGLDAVGFRKKVSELDRIGNRLDKGEKVYMHVRQSRYRPGGAALVNPNTIFVTDRRVIIRNPVRLGLGEHIEEYWYRQITNIRLEKGLFSASVIFYIPGMTEMSKSDRRGIIWGRESHGTIDAISKRDAERMYEYIRGRMGESRGTRRPGGDPLATLKGRLAGGEITVEEYEKTRKALEDGP